MKPHALLDFLKEDSEIKTDRALAKALKVTAPTISKIRKGIFKVSAELILKIHLATEMPVKQILELAKENQSIEEFENL